MATTKTTTKTTTKAKAVEAQDEPVITDNLGPVTDAPINPAIDPSKTAQERLDAMTEQRAEMQRKQDAGIPPD